MIATLPATAELGARLARAAAPAASVDDRPGPQAQPACDPVPAAVLVPIVRHAQPAVLLTVRARHLAAHAGQVAFPGGRIEPGDADPVAAALRETEEEIGLAAPAIAVVGTLPPHRTGTGYRITPVVGLVSPPLRLRPDPAEVEAVFELPLSVVLDRRSFCWREEELLGRRRGFWVVAHERHLIWGATAAMLLALHEALAAPAEG